MTTSTHKRIHLISIGGAVMHNLALALWAQGHLVTGSDDEIFEPSYSRLQVKGLLPEKMGWFPERITSDLDFVILGMHAKKDNPELLRAQEMGVPVYSFPEYIYQESKHKKRVVIAGSHGKTTTTAMVMHVLREMNMAFDYLVGSQLEGFDYMVKVSDAPLIVIEGDEYLTSPIDLKPKFHWYQPHIAMITGVAWDHINVFPTFENYVSQFEVFIQSINPAGALVWYAGDETLQHLSKNAGCKTLAYDTPDFELVGETVYRLDGDQKYPLKIFGRHNLQNMEGAMLVCHDLGISKHDFLNAMGSFAGTARRLEPKQTELFYAAFRDFAHAPSKVTATVKAVKEQFPERKLVALFELHTYSSLRLDFLEHYKGSLDGADEKIIYLNPHVFEMKKMPVLPEKDILRVFGEDTKIIQQRDELERAVNDTASSEKVLLMMSSGNFDGWVLSI
jgi:UDP-N-acetylmuramate: L-alanyl-gamma-D-glutamyl-meso-diaminopimelate ligase